MASSRAEDPEAGFATPAATLISLAIALMATAVTSMGLAELKLSRSDFDLSQTESQLAGAQQRAVLATLGSGADARLRWVLNTDLGVVQALAEPEAPKASLANVAMLDNAAFAKLSVADPETLKTRLHSMTVADALGPALEAADPSRSWRSCARSAVSAFGQGEQLQPPPSRDLTVGPPTLRTGEVWRIRVSAANGWSDDRIVRFTGDLLHPAAVVARRFTKLEQGSDQCDAIISAR